ATTGPGARTMPERVRKSATPEPTLDQRRARVHHEVAIGLMRSGRNPEALGELLQAVRFDPTDARIRLALAEAYRRAERLAETEQHLLAAIELDPDFHEAHLSLSGLYIQVGRYEEATVHARRLLEDPTFPSPW